MRQALLDYIQSLKLVSYKESRELPFSASDLPLYLKNPKKIYVDLVQNSTEEFIQIMNGHNIDNEIAEITVYFSNDAKNAPRDYKETVESIKQFRKFYSRNEYYNSQVTSETEYDNDLLITQIQFRFVKLSQRN